MKNKTALIILALPLLASCQNGQFLGVTKDGWAVIAKEAGQGALNGAKDAALPAYFDQRAKTSAKGVVSVSP